MQHNVLQKFSFQDVHTYLLAAYEVCMESFLSECIPSGVDNVLCACVDFSYDPNPMVVFTCI